VSSEELKRPIDEMQARHASSLLQEY